MENEVSLNEIRDYIEDIAQSIGMKEDISELTSARIIGLIADRKIDEAATIIAQQLGLPITFDVIWVPIDYEKQHSESQFCTSQLARSGRTGGGQESVTAQVEIPSNLPMYGSWMMKSLRIRIKVRESLVRNPPGLFLILAHELSHVLLYALRHKEKENEFYTDLTALMHGFRTTFLNGRIRVALQQYINEQQTTITQTTTTTYGYLNDNQLTFAVHTINENLENLRQRKRKLSGSILLCEGKLKSYKTKLAKFQYYINIISKNLGKKISGDDGKRMTIFYRLGYFDDIQQFVKRCDRKLFETHMFHKELNYYTTNSLSSLELYMNENCRMISDLQKKTSSIVQDIEFIGKYVDYKDKIKFFITSFFNPGFDSGRQTIWR